MTANANRSPLGVIELPRPYLLFLGDVAEIGYAKTAMGLRDWAPDLCVGQYRLAQGVSVGLPDLTPVEAKRAGARSMVIGIANPGGAVADSWMPCLMEALDAGLDLIGGMHAKLNQMPELAANAKARGRALIDVRTPPPGVPVATGKKRRGRRLLTVGTDCALGKKYTALALTRAFQARGVSADFRATGQTGIMIAGRGMPMDAVVADFVAGAAEMLSPDNDVDHWDVIEGQGSLAHPAYAGVSLGLLHGSQPDAIVMCHDPTRTAVLGYPHYALPPLHEAIDAVLRMGALTNPSIRCAGVSLNTSKLDERQARRTLEETSEALGLPVADPMRGGAALQALVESCLSGGDASGLSAPARASAASGA